MTCLKELDYSQYFISQFSKDPPMAFDITDELLYNCILNGSCKLDEIDGKKALYVEFYSRTYALVKHCVSCSYSRWGIP